MKPVSLLTNKRRCLIPTSSPTTLSARINDGLDHGCEAPQCLARCVHDGSGFQNAKSDCVVKTLTETRISHVMHTYGCVDCYLNSKETSLLSLFYLNNLS